ncbi:MAG: hypothetical protein ACO2ZM_09630, partial [Francisellaceae bacterium]
FYPKLNAQPLIDTSTAVINSPKLSDNLYQALNSIPGSTLMYNIDSMVIRTGTAWVPISKANPISTNESITLNNITQASSSQFRLAPKSGVYDLRGNVADLTITTTFSNQSKITSTRESYINNPAVNYTMTMTADKYQAWKNSHGTPIDLKVLKNSLFPLCAPMTWMLIGSSNGSGYIDSHRDQLKIKTPTAGCYSYQSEFQVDVMTGTQSLSHGDWLDYKIFTEDGSTINLRIIFD